MAAAAKRSRGTIVQQSMIESTQSFLQTLPEKAKEDLSLKETALKLKAPLQAALAKGYTYEELAAMLKEKGISISAATLKNYVPTGKRSGKGPSTRLKTRKSAAKQVQSETASPSPVPALETPPEQSPEPLAVPETPSKRRGRATKKTTTPESPKAAEATNVSESTESTATKATSRSRSSAAKARTSTKQTAENAAKRPSTPRAQSGRTRKKSGQS